MKILLIILISSIVISCANNSLKGHWVGYLDHDAAKMGLIIENNNCTLYTSIKHQDNYISNCEYEKKENRILVYSLNSKNERTKPTIEYQYKENIDELRLELKEGTIILNNKKH